MREPTNLLTVPEVADLLRVRESTVYTWAESGALPCYRVGRLLRFDRAEVQSWLASRGNRRRPDPAAASFGVPR
jgi:putative molybdopterin biosynthesis protein